MHVTSGNQALFIRPPNGEWVQLDNAQISVEIRRRMTRTVTHGGEGDDLIDEGSESAIYTVKGQMGSDIYKRVLAIFRGGQPYIHEPYEEREVKVMFGMLRYDGGTKEYTFELIEDIV